MAIGTPLSPSATRVMLLGAGELGKEIAIAFQRLGVEVVAVDRYPNAPGHQVAHRAHVIDMTDPVALSALIERERPQNDTGLVTLCSQRQSEFDLHARAILGLPVDVSLREPGASAVIYGGVTGPGVRFTGLDEALSVPRSEIRLFGKPESFARRRMGVALATGSDLEEARERAKRCAGGGRPLLPTAERLAAL